MPINVCCGDCKYGQIVGTNYVLCRLRSKKEHDFFVQKDKRIDCVAYVKKLPVQYNFCPNCED